jgi:predicted HicB family RNase H-like nuclease
MVAIRLHNGCMKTKQPEQKLTVRFLPDMLTQLRALAQAHKRSLNSEILWGLQQYIDHCKKEGKQDAALQKDQD